MAATTPLTDATAEPSITNVSSTSARLLYYELADRGEATASDLAAATSHDEGRVAALLESLSSQGLVDEVEGTYVA